MTVLQLQPRLLRRVIVIPGPVGDLRRAPRLEVVRLSDRAVEDVRDLFITIKVPD